MSTYRERFLGEDSYAATSFCAPAQKIWVDRSVFKHTAAEKSIKKDVKADHKESLIKHYGANANKYLNIPSNSLAAPMRMQF